MATAYTNSTLEHTSDATFRVWGAEFSGMLASAGLTKTSDTGQIDWVTAARPSTNTVAGYEIWRFNDALQATAPIFFKLNYGTGSNAVYAYVGVYVGTGSDGAGNLTGAASVGTFGEHAAVGTAAINYVTSFPSYACYNSTYGSFFIAYKYGAVASGLGWLGFFGVSRCCDSSGAASGAGTVVVSQGIAYNTTSPRQVFINHSTDTTVTNHDASNSADSVLYPIVPHSIWNGSENPVLPQVYCGHITTPAYRPCSNTCSFLGTEIPSGSTFTATLVGSVQKTYLALGPYCGFQCKSFSTTAANISGVAWLYQ